MSASLVETNSHGKLPGNASCNPEEKAHLLLSIAKAVCDRGLAGMWLSAAEILHVCNVAGVTNQGVELDYMEFLNIICQANVEGCDFSIRPVDSISPTGARLRDVFYTFFLHEKAKCAVRADNKLLVAFAKEGEA